MDKQRKKIRRLHSVIKKYGFELEEMKSVRMQAEYDYIAADNEYQDSKNEVSLLEAQLRQSFAEHNSLSLTDMGVRYNYLKQQIVQMESKKEKRLAADQLLTEKTDELKQQKKKIQLLEKVTAKQQQRLTMDMERESNKALDELWLLRMGK